MPSSVSALPARACLTLDALALARGGLGDQHVSRGTGTLSEASSPANSEAASVASSEENHAQLCLQTRTSARKVLRSFIVRDANGRLTASRIVSRDCYEAWLKTRGVTEDPAHPKLDKVFQRTLTAQISGTDGRQPFSPEEEAAVLAVLRQKRVWPAFALSNSNIGRNGFRSFGFHEKCRLNSSRSSEESDHEMPPAKQLRWIESPVVETQSNDKIEYDDALDYIVAMVNSS